MQLLGASDLGMRRSECKGLLNGMSASHLLADFHAPRLATLSLASPHAALLSTRCPGFAPLSC